MEDALALTEKFGYIVSEKFSLNPCCNGRCTRTSGKVFKFRRSVVLILVVMEDALARRLICIIEHLQQCLNPCCNGRCTRTLQGLKLLKQQSEKS